ncbi:MAG: fatty acid desaturase [Kofleriaceae bacterium]|nr:fatty acid desaturase [Kofleriaceae bacterium]MCL4223206.1 fatty acid desaturase [Myxococcales bacterium]
MELRPLSSYVRELRPVLPPEVFQPARSRLLWLPVHLAAIAAMIVAVASGWVPGFAAPLVSLAIGVSLAGLTFLGHETLHGGVVRGKRLRRVVGWLGFLPFVVSPRLWMAWHNREHHGHTNEVDRDPDMYPTRAAYDGSRLVRVVTDRFALGGRRWTGVLSLLFGFTGQSGQMLVWARRRGLLDARGHRVAIAETALGLAVWATVAVLVGPLAFLFVYVLPLIVANWLVMAFILTNHGLNPQTAINDPLVNSLSVTVPRVADWLTLGFGYHVEHHLFPAMSTRHGPRVRDAIRARWPERYQSMPLGQALLALHRTARVYQDPVTLVDPRSGQAWPTLLPSLGSPPASPAPSR